MPLINCTHCGQPYDIPAEQWPLYQGRRITCTKCKQPFDVVGPPAPPAAGVSPPPFAAPYAGPYAGYTAYPGPGTPPPKQGMSGGKIALLVCGIVLAVVVVCGGIPMAIIFPSFGRAREAANRVKCAANLKQIGLAMLMYQNTNQGMLPNRLDVLVYNTGPGGGEDIDGSVFVCPRDDKNTPSTATGQQLAADLRSNGHLSYVYYFQNKRQRKGVIHGGNEVVMYEPLSDHNNEGANFLFADGRVDFLKKRTAEAVIRDLERGINPPSATSLNAGP